MREFGRIFGCIGLGILSFVIAVYISFVFLSTRDVTKFASSYNEARFLKISKGMSIHDVHHVLGQPLRTIQVKPYEYWEYGDAIDQKKTLFGYQYVFRSGTKLSFDKNGVLKRISGTPKHEMKIGMTKENILRIAGGPTRVNFSTSSLIEYYTVPDDDWGCYRERSIGYDQKLQVSDIWMQIVEVD